MTSPARKRPASDRRVLQEYVKRQTVADADVLKVLRNAYEDVKPALKALEGLEGEGAAVRRDQLLSVRRVLRFAIKVIANGTGLVILDHLQSMVEGAFESQMIYLSETFRALTGSEIDQVRATAAAGLQAARTRLESSKRELSLRVYSSQKAMEVEVERVINSGLARGVSAREMAKDVRQYIRPDTSGGARYAAMRLARTELNNAFHAAQAIQAEESPFVNGVRWRLSSSHPEPDECDDYADEVYPPTEVPLKPHPQCLCFTTPEIDSLADFRAKLRQRAEAARSGAP